MTNKQFKEMTIAEKFEVIANAVREQNAEFAEFLIERAEKQTKANATPRKASVESSKLQMAILGALSTAERMMADDVLTVLENNGYTDDHKQGLTIARVRAGLSALAKEGVIKKFDAERKKDSLFPKVSYSSTIPQDDGANESEQ